VLIEAVSRVRMEPDGCAMYAPAKEALVSRPVIMYITYCEQGQTIAEIRRKASRWGFDGVEFRRKRDGVVVTTGSCLAQIEAGLRRGRLRHVLFGSPGPGLANRMPPSGAAKWTRQSHSTGTWPTASA
jgi:hypothetical protein